MSKLQSNPSPNPIQVRACNLSLNNLSECVNHDGAYEAEIGDVEPGSRNHDFEEFNAIKERLFI